MMEGLTPQELWETACVEHGTDLFKGRMIEAFSNPIILQGVMDSKTVLGSLQG